MSQNMYDVMVIGSGPGGYVAAIKATQLKKKTAIIEKEQFGGTCLNRGCIPTKVLLKSVEALQGIQKCENMGITGVDVSRAALNLKAIQERKKTIVAQLTEGVEGLLWKNGVTIYKGIGQLKDNHTVVVGNEEITADNIIIATGSSAKALSVEVDPNMSLLNSDQILQIEEIPENIVVIGGGIIGIEFAYFLASAGSKVTVIEFLDHILPTFDREIITHVQAFLEQIGVQFHTGSKITEITKNSVLFKHNGSLTEIKTGNVLVSIGRHPNLEGISCEKLGIRTEQGAIVTDDAMRTTVDNIYAIGDVNGKAMLAHVASMEAIIAVKNICGDFCKMEYDSIPSAIFINPEVATVGLTETETKQKYGNVKVGKFPLAANAKAKIAGKEQGFIKVIIEPEYGEIVGVHMFCVQATDMIGEAVAAMKLEATAKELTMTIHPHPTVSEALMEAFSAATDKAIHL